MSTSNIHKETLEQLFNRFLPRLGKSAGNTKSDFKRINEKVFGELSMSEPADSIFTNNFPATLEDYLAARLERGASKVNNRPIRSRLMALYRASQEVTPDDMPADLTEAIRWAMTLRNMTLGEIVRVGGTTIRDWLTGAHRPRRPKKPEKLVARLTDLEQALKIPEGSLVSRAFPNGAPSGVKPKLSDYRRKLATVTKMVFSLSTFPAQLAIAIDKFEKFQRSPALMDGPDGQKLVRAKRWSDRADGCHTAEAYRHIFSYYFGQLLLPNNEAAALALLREQMAGVAFDLQPLVQGMMGQGLNVEDLDFCMLTDREYIMAFVDFEFARNGNNQNSVRILRHIKAIISDRGFLPQHPDLAVKYMGWPETLTSRTDPKLYQERRVEWAAHCHRSWEFVRDLYVALKSDEQDEDEDVQSRSIARELAPIFALEQPIDVLHLMIDRMMAVKPHRIHERDEAEYARWLRSVLIIVFLMDTAVRSINLRLLTYTDDESSNLYRHGDHWQIKYKKSEMKTRRSLKKTLSHTVETLLDEWITKYRNIYVGGNDTMYVFPKMDGKPISTGFLSVMVHRITRDYLPEFPSFGPHAFRHIIATGYIAEDPEGWGVAADILGDRIETVRGHYVHKKTNPSLAKWHNMLDRLRQRKSPGTPPATDRAA